MTPYRTPARLPDPAPDPFHVPEHVFHMCPSCLSSTLEETCPYCPAPQTEKPQTRFQVWGFIVGSGGVRYVPKP